MTADASRYPPADGISGQGGKGGGGRHLPSVFEFGDSVSSSGTAQVLLLLSAGPVAGLANGEASVFFDDVPLRDADGEPSVEGVKLDVTTGGTDEDPPGLPGFNANARTISLRRPLRANHPHVLSDADADAARLTLRFPRGLLLRDQAVLSGTAVRFTIDIWQAGTWHEVLDKTIDQKVTGLFELQYEVHLPRQGRVKKLRVTRKTKDSIAANLVNEVELAAVTWLRWDVLGYDGMATAAITLDARAFGGRPPRIGFDLKGRILRVPSNYDPVQRRYDGMWDGRFVNHWSDNPAWVIYDILVDPQWGLGLPADSIDRYDLYAVARYCDEMVTPPDGSPEPRFTCNMILRQRQRASQLLAEICAGIHVLFFWSGGRLRFRADKPEDALTIVTNANVIDGEFVYQGPGRTAEFSHAMVTFRNQMLGGQTGIETAVDDDAMQRFGFRPREVLLVGCSRRSEAQRHARWLVETARSQRRAVSYRASLDHFADQPVRPGDLVMIADEKRLVNATDKRAATSVITAMEKDDFGNLIRFHGDLPDALMRASTTDLRLRYEDEDGSIALSRVTPEEMTEPETESGWRLRLEMSAPAPRKYSPMVLCPVDAAQPELYRVISVREVGDAVVEIGAVHHDPEKFARIDGGQSLPDPVVSALPDIAAPLATMAGLTVVEAERRSYGGLRHETHLSWQDSAEVRGNGPDRRVAGWQITATGPNASRLVISSPVRQAILTDLAPGDWEFAIRPVSWTGTMGPQRADTHRIHGRPATPDRPPIPDARSVPLGVDLGWASLDADHIRHYEIWQGANRHDANFSKIGVTTANQFIINGLTAGQFYRFKIRARHINGGMSGFSDIVRGRAGTALVGPPGPEGPQGTAGERGRDGINGRDGRNGIDGQDGRDGNDGRDGRDGTQILTIRFDGNQWSDDQANAALAARRDGRTGRLAGDSVTLLNTAVGFAETRIWDGAEWLPAGEQINGKSLIRNTVTAPALLLDEVSLRGNAASGALEVGRLVAPVITLPTEIGGRFQTFMADREVTAHKYVNYAKSYAVFGPLITERDAFSEALGVRGQPVYLPFDRVGDDADHHVNSNFNRFYFKNPKFRLDYHYDMILLRPAGNFVLRVEPRVRLLSGKNARQRRVLSGPQTRATNAVRPTYGDGPFIGGDVSSSLYRRHMAGRGRLKTSHKVATLPRGSDVRTGHTERFSQSFEWRFRIDETLALTDEPLYLELSFAVSTHNLSTRGLTQALLRNATFTASTLT